MQPQVDTCWFLCRKWQAGPVPSSKLHFPMPAPALNRFDPGLDDLWQGGNSFWNQHCRGALQVMLNSIFVENFFPAWPYQPDRKSQMRCWLSLPIALALCSTWKATVFSTKGKQKSAHMTSTAESSPNDKHFQEFGTLVWELLYDWCPSLGPNFVCDTACSASLTSTLATQQCTQAPAHKPEVTTYQRLQSGDCWLESQGIKWICENWWSWYLWLRHCARFMISFQLSWFFSQQGF